MATVDNSITLVTNLKAVADKRGFQQESTILAQMLLVLQEIKKIQADITTMKTKLGMQ